MAEPQGGLPAAEALWCLLRLRGKEGGLEPSGEGQDREGPAEAMVPFLAAAGLQARPVWIRDGDLAILSLPTLAQHRDGSWLVLKARTRKGFLVVGGTGPFEAGAGELRGCLSGQALDLAPGLPPGRTLWIRLRALMGTHSAVLALIVAVTVAIQMLGLVTPALTGVVMNRALPDGARSLLGLVVAGIVLMALFHTWLDYVRGQAILYFTQKLDLSTERGLLEHILGLPFRELRGRPLGDWLQAFAGIGAARGLLAEKTLGVLLDGALAVVLLGVMAALLPGAAALVGGTALALGGAGALVGRREAALQAREVEVAVRAQSYLSELLAGVATLKAAGTETGALGRWRRLYRQGLALALRRGRISLWAGTGTDALGRVMEAGLLVWGGLQVLRGGLSLGTFLAFLQLASAFMSAVQGLLGTYLALRVLAPQLAKATEVLGLPAEPKPSCQRPSARPETVVMEGVWFRYRPEGPWILSAEHLAIAPGAKHRLSGPSGSGKSTLLRLLAGLEVPEKGRILIGGQAPGSARHRLIYLPQFVQFCGGSLLENLTVLSGGAPTAAIMAAAAATGLEDWVATLPMGFKTNLPHGARTLSGGQRQWVALTAAMASGRGVLLLDEPMANLDAVAAGKLNAALEAGPWTLVTAGHGTLPAESGQGNSAGAGHP